MLLHVIRGVFLLLLIAIALSHITAGVPEDVGAAENGNWLFSIAKDAVLLGVVGLGILAIGLDMLIPRKSLSAMSGLFFGLIAGLLIAYVFSLVVDLVVTISPQSFREPVIADVASTPTKPNERTTISKQLIGYRDRPVVGATKLLVGVMCCYFAISFIVQTKDDIRFIIPYVEFDRQTKGGRPLVLDTSAIIDGRIADIAQTRVFDNPMVVPRFVLHELQMIADSNDRMKRKRGRRGLDIVKKLQGEKELDVTIFDTPTARTPVDQRLVSLAEELNGKIVTTDYNLNKVAQIRGIEVVNVNDLANAMKSVVLPGEPLTVRLVKAGEEAGQGVGYLEDGTMVVVEGGRTHLGQMIEIVVTSSLQTSAGRMIFGRIEGNPNDRHGPRNA